MSDTKLDSVSGSSAEAGEWIALETDTGPFQLVRFSPDGNELAARSEGGMIHVWRAPSWEAIEAAEAKESE